jgi:hypothetical protein
MDVDEPVLSVLPDLSIADRRFLLTLPETTNKEQLLQEIKDAILKDRMYCGCSDALWLEKWSFFCLGGDLE